MAPTVLAHLPAPPDWVAVYDVTGYDDAVREFLPRRRPLAAWAQIQDDDGTTRLVGLVATDGANLVLAEELGRIDSYIPKDSMTPAESAARLKAELAHQRLRWTLLHHEVKVRMEAAERRTLPSRIRTLLSRIGVRR
uniref:hypothetical protein n=1 Tax=Streptosporangium sp. CA-235898 TaxID=3240073 RepID=UPI003F4968F2